MIEQVMQLKNRYDKMVREFKEEDFKGWFAEFFKLYPFIVKIRWEQSPKGCDEYGNELIHWVVNQLEVWLSISFVKKYPGFHGLWDQPDVYLVIADFTKEQHKQYPDLGEAVKALRELFKAEDVLQHVFGNGVKVIVTPEAITIDEYEQ